MATKNKKGSAAKAEAKGQAGASKAKGAAPAKADPAAAKRKLGLRGAAPWAARHAAKHAAERARAAALPPPPGSARATIRTPQGAEDIKLKVRDLHNALAQLKGLRKNVGKTFYDIGGILKDVQARRLYEAKGYGSFEAFLEREIDLGKTTSLRLVRLVGLFVKEAALELGMDRVIAGLAGIEAFDAQGAGFLRRLSRRRHCRSARLAARSLSPKRSFRGRAPS
jgi:hypothetical protein